ncbi:pentatricopeptide repeat-containing protein At1g19720 [Cryptomeria japonica]|uniref:pentatricopeptide repeat-containing protein At1g19720 n=1 Tax=Cryptomeria japonica TaxID=3369 RepID=UPI0027DA040A|nr:pentatricopeptide repeat-containing protein At1g19720 [Cryptomeria japonica]
MACFAQPLFDSRHKLTLQSEKARHQAIIYGKHPTDLTDAGKFSGTVLMVNKSILIVHRGFAFAKSRVFQTKLVNMYGKCGRFVDARKEFDDMTKRDVSSCDAIIAAYKDMGILTFATILAACAKVRALKQGMDLHGSIIKRGFLSDVVIVNALVDMYTKCGKIYKARELFDKIPHKNEVSWNAMVAVYTQNGVLDEALRLFDEIPQPNIISWNVMVTRYVQNGLVEKALGWFLTNTLGRFKAKFHNLFQHPLSL